MKIYTHPSNYKTLKKQFDELNNSNIVQSIYPLEQICIIDDNIPQYTNEYHVPQNVSKYYEYEESDLPWLIYCGWVDIKKIPTIYVLRNNKKIKVSNPFHVRLK